MTRRRVVVLASAATVAGIIGLFVIGLALLTKTDFGRERLRRLAVSRVASAMKGKLFLGRVSGSIFTDLVVDSIELRDPSDSLFLAAGRTYIDFDPRDLLDQRIVIPRLEMTRATVHLDIDSAGTINFRKIFPPGPPAPPGPPRTTRRWGDYIAVRNAQIRDLTVQVRMPWSPDTSLRGARRDSAIAYALNRPDKEIVRVGSHFEQTRRFSNGRLVLDSARLDDRDPPGRVFYINSLDLDGSDPPLEVRRARGIVRVKADSLFLNVPSFNLPGSAGSAAGKVWWGNGPTRYDLNIVGDTVSLADVAWVYPTLPRTGGGRMKLAIRNATDPNILDYVLTEMDVRSTDSWLRGRMTFGIGAPVTIVKDVDVVAQPLDFRLVETLSGAPLPYPFRGTLTGTVRARGGPLDRFIVDAADIVFRDANVPGAVTVGSGSGELNILEPSNTSFRGFDLQLDQLDLRTVQFLNPAFPRLNGTIAGRTTLDSTLLDIRFRNADLTHADGSGPATRVTGAGRVTFAEVTTYDVALDAAPLSFTTLRRAYTEGRIPLRGEYSGPLRLQGTLQDLEVVTELRGPSGLVAYDGRVDADSIGGYGVHGALRVAGLDLRTFLDTAVTPPTRLTGRADIDVRGDSLATLSGSALVELERSLIDSILVYEGTRGRMRFIDRRLVVDTVLVESVAGSLVGSGGLGLSPEVNDTIGFTVKIDSIGAFRRFLTPKRAAATNNVEPEVDSLKFETEEGIGRLSGSLDTLGVMLALRARDVDALGVRADTLRVSAEFADVLREPRGVLEVSGNAMSVADVRLTAAGATVNLAGADSGDFSLFAEATNGPRAQVVGGLAFAGDTTTVRVNTLLVGIREHRLSLAAPSDVRIEPGRIVVDTARLVGQEGEEVLLGGDFPAAGAIRAFARVDSLHLADIGDLTQFRVPLAGTLVGAVDVAGTRSAPEIGLEGSVAGAQVGEFSIARITFNGRYANERAVAQLQLLHQDSVVADLRANLPVDYEAWKLVENDTLRVTLRSRDVDLRLIESFTPKVRRAGGRFTANVDAAGRVGSARLAGNVSIVDGAATLPDAGIRLDQITADVVTSGDTVHIRRLSAHSGDEPNDLLLITGLVTDALTKNPSFNIEIDAREFNMVDTRRLATLWISTPQPLRLTGSLGGSLLQGTVLVDRGVIYMPEQSDKQLITLQLADLAGAGLDTTAARRLRLMPTAPSSLVSGLTVQGVRVIMGPNVRIQSAESREMNIQLGGALEVDVARGNDGSPQLVLNGELLTERGTYLLNVGGIVQRTFSIESGTLRFFDDPDFNPLLDIRAVYAVGQVRAVYGGRNDVRIGVRIGGTLAQPSLSLYSADSLRLSQSDLISYLVLGRPSFEIGGTPQQNASQISAILLSTAGNYLSSRLSGGFFDYVQLQTAADRLQISEFNIRQAGSVAGSVLSGTQLGIGKQINDRTIISLNTGVCVLGQADDPATLWRSIGAKIEYQIRPDLGIGGSLDPPLSSLLCGLQTQGFSTSLRQVGFDLFRNFRW